MSGELTSGQPNSLPKKSHITTRKRSELANEHVCEQILKILDGRDLDFFVTVLANPDWHVEQFNVLEP